MTTIATPTPGVFYYREPAKIVGDIIQIANGLLQSQVILNNQKIFIPTVGPLIVIRYLGPSKLICSVDEYNPVSETEIQSITVADRLQIDIMSYDDSARFLRAGVFLAIGSLLSESQQELYQMYIAKFPGPFIDTSYLEATKMVWCYTAELETISVNQNTKPIGDYYTDFTRAVPPLLAVNL